MADNSKTEVEKRLDIVRTEYEKRYERAKKVFDQNRRALAADLAQEGGPPWETTSTEARWRQAREEMRVCKDIISALAYVAGEKS